MKSRTFSLGFTQRVLSIAIKLIRFVFCFFTFSFFTVFYLQMTYNLPLLKLSPSEKVLSKIPLPIEEEPEPPYKPTIQLQPLYDFNPKSVFAKGNQNDDKSPDYKQKMLEIMKYEQRTPQEAQLLYDYIKHFTFFESFNERNPHNNLETEAFIQLCQKARYEKHPAKKVLYREGDAPTGKVYLIISGAVYTVNKSMESICTENTSHNEVTTVDDSSSENSAENTPKRDFDESPIQQGPSMGFEGFVNTRMRQSSIKIVSNSRSPKNGFISPDHRTNEIKPGKASRLSIFVANSTDLNDTEKRDNSQGNSLTKLGQKLKEFQEEKNSYSRPARQGFANLMKMSLLANIQENDSMNEQPEGTGKEEALLNFTRAARRKKSLKLSSVERQNSQTPSSKSNKKTTISLKQLANENGFVRCKVQQGGFFGEKALFSKQPRLSTVITAMECEFLVLNKKDFQEVSEKYDLKRRVVLEFMKEYIPNIEEFAGSEMLEDMMHALQEKKFDRDTYIVRENDPGNHLYLIYEGTCELIKKVVIDETSNMQESLGSLKKLVRVNPVRTQGLSICKMERGEFIGEECVFGNRGVYDLSVKAYSAYVKAFMITKPRFFAKFPARTRENMERIFKNKRKSHVEIAGQIIMKKYPLFRVVYDDTYKDLLSRNYIKLLPKKRSELTSIIHHEQNIRASFRTPKNLFNSTSTINFNNNQTFDFERKYRLNITDLNDKPIMKKEEFTLESSLIEKNYSPSHKELKKKLEAFSRTISTMKNRPKEGLKNEISVQSGLKSYRSLKTFYFPKDQEVQSPTIKKNKQETSQELDTLLSRQNSSQYLPVANTPKNQENKVSTKGKGEDSLRAYLISMTKNKKETSKAKNKTNGNSSPKKLIELTSSQNDPKYSFTRVLEKMMNSAKAKKNKRLNDSFTIRNNLEDDIKPSFDNFSVNTPRLPKVTTDSWSINSPQTPNTPLSAKLKGSISSSLQIKTASISNSFCGSSTEISQEIKECHSETPRRYVKLKRIEISKRSNFYQRTLKKKALGNASSEWRDENSKEYGCESEYFGKGSGSFLGKALNGIAQDDSKIL